MSFVSIFITNHVGPSNARIMQLIIIFEQGLSIYYYTIIGPDKQFFRVKLRNRSALAVNCWVLIHCLEVGCKRDIITSAQRNWYIFLQPTDSELLLNNSRTRADLIWFEHTINHKNTFEVFSFFELSSNALMRSCNSWAVSHMFTCICNIFQAWKQWLLLYTI